MPTSVRRQTARIPITPPRTLSPGVLRCRRRFLSVFPGGFRDETYIDWERDYKWAAHERWEEALAPESYRRHLERGEFAEIAATAVRIESRTNLLFSFEKMALRDAIRSPKGARLFAEGLYEFLYGADADEQLFEAWCRDVSELPRVKTRVLTWPLITVFGFIARPDKHVFLKPNVTRVAAKRYGFDFTYRSKPNWETYQSLLTFARTVKRDNADLRPRDMIDLQGFIWVAGSEEYD
ncbi:MAG TPA: hypothetical protein VGG84_12305 [Gemmatimonadaceae bacterium]|jgi:hypothetical protein